MGSGGGGKEREKRGVATCILRVSRNFLCWLLSVMPWDCSASPALDNLNPFAASALPYGQCARGAEGCGRVGYIAGMKRKVGGGFEWKARRYDGEQRA